jgi:hypothetical protein
MMNKEYVAKAIEITRALQDASTWSVSINIATKSERREQRQSANVGSTKLGSADASSGASNVKRQSRNLDSMWRRWSRESSSARSFSEEHGESSMTRSRLSFLKKRLNNAELIAFALGLAVGAAGALTGSLSYQHARLRNAPQSETYEQWLENECLMMALGLPRGEPNTDLPSECSSVVAKLRAHAHG